MPVVRPYLVTFKRDDDKWCDQFILIESTRSRKKDWIIRASDDWDNGYQTIINVSKDCDDFIKKFTVTDGTPEYCFDTWHQDFPHYSESTFYWNCINYAFIIAADNLMSHFDIESQYKKSFKYYAPDELHLADPKYLSLPSYKYDYLSAFKDHYKKHIKKIVDNF